MSPWPNYSITIIRIGKLMQVTSSIKTLNSSTTKKCKCSSEIQTRAANPHTPSSDKSLKASIRDLCDRGKTRIREKALRNESLDRNDGRNVQRSAYVSGSGRRFCLFEFNYKDVSPSSIPKLYSTYFIAQKNPHICGDFVLSNT